MGATMLLATLMLIMFYIPYPNYGIGEFQGFFRARIESPKKTAAAPRRDNGKSLSS